MSDSTQPVHFGMPGSDFSHATQTSVVAQATGLPPSPPGFLFVVDILSKQLVSNYFVHIADLPVYAPILKDLALKVLSNYGHFGQTPVVDK